MILQRLFSKSKKKKTLNKIDDKTSKSLKVGGGIAAGSYLGNAILLNKVNDIGEKSKINSSEKEDIMADCFSSVNRCCRHIVDRFTILLLAEIWPD